MLEFLKESLICTFTEAEDIFDYILGILAWICILGLSFLIIWGLLFLVDYTYRPINEGTGTVISKEFIPEHTETIWVYNAALKMNMPQTTHYSNEWRLWIDVNNLRDDVLVSENYYNSIKVGQQLKLKYSVGRIWKTLYIKEVLYDSSF